MTKKKLIRLQVGDVIKSPDLVCCAYSNWDYDKRKPENKHLQLTKDQKTSCIQHYLETEEIRGNRTVTVTEKVVDDLASYDPSRANAEFLVTSARWDGGSTGGGMNGYDDYPDGWALLLVRLNQDGSYTPDSETIKCYENNTGCFIKETYITQYEIVGKMEKTFVRMK